MMIDWNDLWKNAVLSASARNRRADQITFWDGKAPIYAKMEEDEGIERAGEAITRFGIDAHTTILDIGCGPGTLTIPLAKAAASVTALDQSQGMLAEVKKRAEKEGIHNIRYVKKKWEDTVPDKDIARYDIVIASYSLDVLDIQKALQKIHETATETVCLYWFAGSGSSFYDALWPRVFDGESYCAFPDHIYLLNVLHQMKIYPDVKITTMKSKHPFLNLDDAVDYWRDNLQVTSPEQTKIIRQYLLKRLEKKGGEFLYNRTMRTGMICWRKDDY